MLLQNFEVGSELEAKIVEERDYGFMLELPSGITTLLHNSQMSDTPVCFFSVRLRGAGVMLVIS